MTEIPNTDQSASPEEKAGDAGAPPEAEGRGSKGLNKLIAVIIAAAAVFLLMEELRPYIEVQLREISSIIAGFLLRLVGFVVTRDGTLLTTGVGDDAMKFDVVGACSGSNTLNVLVAVGIVWVGTHSRLPLFRKVLCGLLSVPIAIFANGVRVAILVGGSDAIGFVIGEDHPLHYLVGLFGFVLAMLIVFGLTEWMALPHEEAARRGAKRMGERPKLVITLLALFFIFLPYLILSISYWSPTSFADYEHHGYVFPLAALAIGIVLWFRWPRERPRPLAGILLLLVVSCMVFVAIALDMNIVRGVALLLSVLAVVLLYRGLWLTVAMIPLTALAFVGFYSSFYILDRVLLRLGLSDQSLMAWAWPLRFPLAAVALIAFAIVIPLTLPRARRLAETPRVPSKPSPVLLNIALAIVFAVAALQGYYYGRPAQGDIKTDITFSYLQGDWVGSDLPIGAYSLKYFGEGGIKSRNYTRGEEDVQVLLTSSSGDRHRHHPPEYCLTGGGWIIQKSDNVTVTVGNGDRIHATRLVLTLGDRTKTFVYWFSDGEVRHPDYVAVTTDDSLRRLQGVRTNWFLFRVMSSDGMDAVEGFLDTFEWTIGEETATGENLVTAPPPGS
jgi:EpsI family protein